MERSQASSGAGRRVVIQLPKKRAPRLVPMLTPNLRKIITGRLRLPLRLNIVDSESGEPVWHEALSRMLSMMPMMRMMSVAICGPRGAEGFVFIRRDLDPFGDRFELCSDDDDGIEFCECEGGDGEGDDDEDFGVGVMQLLYMQFLMSNVSACTCCHGMH